MTTPPTPAEPLTDAELAGIRHTREELFKTAGFMVHGSVVCDCCGLIYWEHLHPHWTCPCGRFGQRMDTATNHDIAKFELRLLSEVERLRAANSALDAKVMQQQREIMELRTEVERGRV